MAEHPVLSDLEFRGLLNWWMRSDVNPDNMSRMEKRTDTEMVEFAFREAQARGFDSVTVAYHNFEVKLPQV